MDKGNNEVRKDSGIIEPNLSKAIGWLNLFLSIFIVLLHVNFETANGGYNAAKNVINVISDCAVPAFFCISAYLAFRNYKIEKYITGLRKKAQTILVPYLLWSALGVMYQACLSLLTTKTLVFVSLQDFLLSEYNGPLWFLRVLFGFVILSPIIYFVAKRKILVIIVMLGLTFCNLFVYTFSYDSMLFWLPVYLLGAFLGINYKEFLEDGDLIRLKACRVVRILIIPLLALAIGFGVIFYEKNLYYLYRIISGILVISIFILTTWKKFPPSILQNSFFTFCAHALLLGAQNVFLRVFGNSTLGLICGYVMCACVIWGATVVTAELLKKYVPKVHTILVGGRKNIGV